MPEAPEDVSACPAFALIPAIANGAPRSLQRSTALSELASIGSPSAVPVP